MNRTSRRVDHAVHAVGDLDVAAGEYLDLGFTVTPRADHPFGTSNRLVVLENAYIELVSVTRPSLISGGFAAEIQRYLDTGPGLAYLVLSSAYAATDMESLAVSGLAVGDVFQFSRPATLSTGRRIEASFSLVLTPGFPDLGVFLCQHHTPEAIWDPGHMQHANGAVRLAKLTGEGRLDAEELRRLEILTGARPRKEGARTTVDLEDVELEFHTSSHRGPRLDGIEIWGSQATEADVAGIHLSVRPLTPSGASAPP